jgi:3-keto-L-gulonate-6-phosphate decarboxylase
MYAATEYRVHEGLDGFGRAAQLQDGNDVDLRTHFAAQAAGREHVGVKRVQVHEGTDADRRDHSAGDLSIEKVEELLRVIRGHGT